MSTAISFDAVTKHYRGAREYRALRDDLAGVVGRIAGRSRSARTPVRALEELSFEIPEGQSFALIGANGAGKTTALRIASRITYPTTGRIRVRGRVGALIEVGTGMHPELTGRENVWLYGRILGLTRRDIGQRFDTIVDFAGIGRAIDQPVKQFSSGMQLRLGFSLAAHLEPDVLLVDEAIAVGDAGFQYRCVERMSELVREGRTLVFVSHDMSAIETLCERAILLHRGRIASDGRAREIVQLYLATVASERLAGATSNVSASGSHLEITRVSLHNEARDEVDVVEAGQQMTARLHYRAAIPIKKPIFSVGLSDGRFGCFTLASMLVDGQVPEVIEGEGYVDCTFTDLPLHPRTYEIWGSVRGHTGFGDLVDWQRLRMFRVTGEIEGAGIGAITHSMADAPVRLPYRWSTSNGGGGVTVADVFFEYESAWGRAAISADDVDLLSEFTGLTRDECLERLRTYRPDVIARAWRKSNPQTPGEIRRFYSETTDYIWELLAWNSSDQYRPHLNRLHRFAKVFPPQTHPRALDYGSGVGTAALTMAKLGYRITIADVPGTTLDFCRARLTRLGVPFETLEITNDLPAVPPDSCDALISFDVLEHLPDPSAVAKALVEALTLGGGAAVVGSFGGENEHPQHLHDGIERFRGYRWSLYFQTLGMRHLGGDLYVKVNVLSALARRARYRFWRMTGIYVQRLQR